MSKERLEEIKEHFSYCIDKGLVIGEQEDELLHELYEQAGQNIDLAVAYDNAQKEIRVLKNKNERFQELENHLTEMAVARYKDSEELDKTHKENKRYHEVIEQIKHIISHPFSKTWSKDKALHQIDGILKALELERENKQIKEAYQDRCDDLDGLLEHFDTSWEELIDE